MPTTITVLISFLILAAASDAFAIEKQFNQQNILNAHVSAISLQRYRTQIDADEGYVQRSCTPNSLIYIPSSLDFNKVPQ